MIDSDQFLKIKSHLLRPSEIAFLEKAIEEYGDGLVAQGGVISLETCEQSVIFIANKRKVLTLGVKEGS